MMLALSKVSLLLILVETRYETEVLWSTVALAEAVDAH